MKHFAPRLSMTILCSSIAASSLADITETITASAPTKYCIEQTSVRGDFDNLIIDHNLIVPPEDHFKSADIFVGARFKSRPDELWLLSGIQWRKINSTADIVNAEHKHYEELPLVVPLSVFYEPFDVSAAVGDGEIWVGYGLRGAAETTLDSFEDMKVIQRYSLLWEALPPPSTPASGIHNSTAMLCFDTSEVTKIFRTASVGPVGFAQEAPPVQRIDGATIPVGSAQPAPPVERNDFVLTIPVGFAQEAPPVQGTNGATIPVGSAQPAPPVGKDELILTIPVGAAQEAPPVQRNDGAAE